ncbi:MAG: beta-ketoacyl synthase N-terminal-like domain-containing protein, partial [Acidobacteriota bacterium]
QKIVIVDPETLSGCEPDLIGEIWVSGPSVAQGYWNRPEDTASTFHAYLAETGEGPFLRTGDLGFLRDGELFVTGRLKDLIIIDGRNHYPQDIELTVEKSHPALRPACSAAFSVDIDGQERLFVVVEVERNYYSTRHHSQEDKVEDDNRRAQQRENLPHFKKKSNYPLDVDAVFKSIFRAVAVEHELDVYGIVLLKAGTIPKTLSGKIQRHACRTGLNQDSLEVIAKMIGKEKRKELRPNSIPDATDMGKQISGRVDVSYETIKSWLISQLCQRFNIDYEEIDIKQPFAYYGLRSVDAISISGELETWLGRKLSANLLYEYPNIELLSYYLAGIDRSSISITESRLIQADNEVKSQPIAIVGIGCRFPGADSPQAFWQILCEGLDMISEIPIERWNSENFYDPNPAMPGKINTRWGGFLKNVDKFDPAFFGISPREAISMDPQQRLLLEVTWEALEDAGLVPEKLSRKPVGVFIGISTNDYGQLQVNDIRQINRYSGTGNSFSVAANRISYLLDLRGPSLAIDTACSSSLVAVHLACQSIYNGESSLAIAGGVNLILSPAITINFSKAGTMASDGRCKTFDARADGYVRSEGAGVIVLKPLSMAIADCDPIYALILGSAINQDGRTNGLMAPNVHAQEAVLRDAYRRAGISPGQVQYVEAHGTGTLLGDPIEAKALATVLSIDRASTDKCIIGSVKTNIGHLESAAGIAGLIKVALSLKHKAIPASLHFENPNPHIAFDELPIKVQQDLTPWPNLPGPAFAGVSSFGFGGTNSHVVLQEPPVVESSQQKRATDGGPYLLPISAQNVDALRPLALAYRDMLLQGEQDLIDSDTLLRDLCYTASVRRTHHNHRLALVANSQAEMVKQLTAYLNNEPHTNIFTGRKELSGRRRIAFVFPGQGPQWLGMGRELFEKELLFRSKLEQIDELFRRRVGWSLLVELMAERSSARFEEIEIIQPIIFAIQVALATLWRSWGIEPDAVVGHSLGEIAAAHIAGVLSLPDAVSIALHRSRLMQAAAGKGCMAALALSIDEARKYLCKYEGRIAIAAINSPQSITLSGDRDAIEEVLPLLQQNDIFCRILSVNVASHSHHMQPLRSIVENSLQDLQPQPPAIPIISTVTGEHASNLDFNAAYWGRQLRETVRFSAAIDRLAEDDYTVFLEVSSHPTLAVAITECLRSRDLNATVLASLRRDEGEIAVMHRSLAALYAMGYQLEWDRLYPQGHCIKLPQYPWQRKRYWIENWQEPSDQTKTRQTVREQLNNHSDPFVYNGELVLSGEASNGQRLNNHYAALSNRFLINSLGENGKNIDQTDGFLRFVPFSEAVPGFSWISTWFEPERHKEAFQLILEKHVEIRSILLRGIDLS